MVCGDDLYVIHSNISRYSYGIYTYLILVKIQTDNKMNILNVTLKMFNII